MDNANIETQVANYLTMDDATFFGFDPGTEVLSKTDSQHVVPPWAGQKLPALNYFFASGSVNALGLGADDRRFPVEP